MIVRLARFDDITNMVIFGRQQHEKSALGHLPFSPAAFRKSLHEIIRGGNGDVLLAINKAGEIRGLLIAWHEALLWTKAKVATDIHFVAEQGGDMLLRAFRKWALERGCSQMFIGTMSDKHIGPRNAFRIKRFFERMGLTAVGNVYRMEL